MTIDVPTGLKGEDLANFEAYLKRNVYPFKTRKSGGINYFTITIDEPINAFWIGSNLTAIVAGLKLPIIEKTG